MTLEYARTPNGLCSLCKHYDSEETEKGFICKAFPDGMPWEIAEGQFDHREPHPKDNGMRFELREGYQIPDWMEEEYEKERAYREESQIDANDDQ